MKIIARVALLLAAASGHAAADHPIAKVVTLLQDLMGKVKSEGQAEEVSYTKFLYWCKTSTAELSDAITDEKDTIDTLSSTIDSKTKDSSVLKDDISKLEDEIKDLQASDKAATDDDKSRNKLYLETEKDLKSTVSSIDDAIKALVAAGTATDSKLLLAERSRAQQHVRDVFALIATVATDSEQNSLMGFLGSSSAPAPAPAALVQQGGAPVAAAGDATKHVKKYSFKSDNVIELLKGLKLKFEDELLAATKAETNAQNAYALSKDARDATTKATEASKKQKETDLADAEGALKSAQADMKDEKADLKADSAAFSKTEDSCRMKKAEWEERTAIRKQELEAMAAAIKIMAKVSGVRTEAPSNPTMPTAPVKLIQALSFLQRPADPQTRAVQLLRATATTYHSKALERLAMGLSSHVPGQFQDVINSIQKMIFRLKQEQTDEDNHKAWCDMEVSKTNTSIDAKDDKIEELSAKIKEANAKVVTLITDIKTAAKLVADIKTFQKEATEIRQTGKKENTVAIDDAVAAQKAITNAIAVLEAFYKSTGSIKKEPWEFLQEPVKLPKDPATWDSSYTGVADPAKAGTGVIAVLEATSADFSKMEANTRSQEITDQKEYEDAMKTNSIELARRSKESDMKSAQKKRLTSKVADLTAQKKHVTDELESTNQYYKDLMPACISGDSTYLDRKAARDAEIAALKQAQTILDSAFAGAPAPAAAKSFLQRRERVA